MPSIKQLQNRLLNKKRTMNKVSVNLATAQKDIRDITSKRLSQSKISLDKDIQKLERQLVIEKRTCREKGKLEPLMADE